MFIEQIHRVKTQQDTPTHYFTHTHIDRMTILL
jgi:hypothetical protein